MEIGAEDRSRQNPKAEIRKKTEIRSPNGSHHELGFGPRVSDLLRISAFGFRNCFHTMPFNRNQSLPFRVFRVFRGLTRRFWIELFLRDLNHVAISQPEVGAPIVGDALAEVEYNLLRFTYLRLGALDFDPAQV